MKRIVTILAAAAAVWSARAQETVFPTADAKSMGMGGVQMTTLAASHAIYTNSAAAAFSMQKLQLSGSYLSQKEYDYYATSGYYNFDSRNVVEAGWRQLRYGSQNNDMSVDAGYTRRIGERWGVGVVARYLHLERPDRSANAIAVDLSALYVMPLEGIGHYTTLRFGGKLGNVGGYVGDTDYTLPMYLTAGAAFDTFVTDAHEVTLGLDAGYYFTPGAVRGFQASLGAEYNLMQLFLFRAGYHFGERDAYYPSYASLGAGVRFMHLRLDFAYLFAKKDTFLRNTWSLSFGFDF